MFELIIEQPLLYQQLPDGVRRALLRRFPYAVFYLVEGDALFVLAVLHTHRDPDLWRQRRG